MRTVRAAILLLTGMLLSGCFSDSTSKVKRVSGQPIRPAATVRRPRRPRRPPQRSDLSSNL